MNLDEDIKKKIQIISAICIILSMLTLAYGSKSLGVWHSINMDAKISGDGTTVGFEMKIDSYIEEAEMEMDFDQAWENEIGDVDEETDIDYSSDEEEVVDNSKLLVYLSIASALGIIVFCNSADLEKTKIATFGLILTSLASGVYFAMEWGEFMEDFGEGFSSSSGLQDFSMDGFSGSESVSENLEGAQTEVDFDWGPGIAWYIVTIVIPLLGGFIAYTLNNIESSNTLSYQNEYQYSQVESTSMPTIPSLEGPEVSFGSNNIRCPNCQTLIDPNSHSCLNCGFQNR